MSIRPAAAFTVCALLLPAQPPHAGALQVPSRDSQTGAPRTPRTAAEWVARGDKSYSYRDYAGAAGAYANAVRLNPKDARTLLKLSVSSNEIGRLPDTLSLSSVLASRSEEHTSAL